MVVEQEIDKLIKENKRSEVRKIVDEYKKQIKFHVNAPFIREKTGTFIFVIIGIFLGIGALVIGDEVSLVVKLIYIVPLILSSITILILYFKAKSSDFSDEKTMELMLNFILLETICICFLSSYFYQYFLFKDFTQIDYLKSMGFVLVCIGLITILTLLDAPKKFMKEFKVEKKKYIYPGAISGGLIYTLVLIANITKPYTLLLILAYGLIMILTRFYVYGMFKYSKYDYIKNLKY